MASHTGLRVAVVDDNEITRVLLRITIQGDAHTVVGDASTVCLEVMMPDMSGLELLVPV